jgi:hypothetical protein
MTGWFEFRSNPVKLAHMLAVNNLIRRDFNKTEEGRIELPLSEETELQLMRDHQNTYNFGFKGLGYDVRHAMRQPCAIDLTGKAANPTLPDLAVNKVGYTDKSDGNFFIYTGGSGGRCFLSATVNDTSILTGFVGTSGASGASPFGDGSVTFGKTNFEWVTLSMTKTFEDVWKKRYLLAITGNMQNTGQVYQLIHNNKVTLNDAGIDTTGVAPILCEAVSACVRIKSETQVKYYSLDENGDRMSNFLTDKNKNGLWEVIIEPEHGTIWYEVEIEK